VSGTLLAAALLYLLTSSWSPASPSVFPTGTTIYKPDKAYNCYVVFGGPDGRTHLIDMDGLEVHRWEHSGFPSVYIDPVMTGGKRGHVLVQLSNAAQPDLMGHIFANTAVGELDWSGNVVWQWGSAAPGGAARQTHDIGRLSNGNTLILSSNERIVVALSTSPIADQVVNEVDPAGKVVWRWSVADHIDEFGFSAAGMTLLRASLAAGDQGDGFLTINDVQPVGENRWFDGGDHRFAPDNLLISSREASFLAIIDHATGSVVWRIGPYYPDDQPAPSSADFTRKISLRPGLHLRVPRQIDQISGQHDAHFIPKGLPGAGDVILFDNEAPSGFPPTRLAVLNGSRVLEVNPTTFEIVWQYTGLDSGTPLWMFDSTFISSARRLPNGNTLIDEGMNGRVFQITSGGEIVWEYISPFFARQVVSETDQKHEAVTNWIYRAQPVPYAWAPEGTSHHEIPVRRPDNSSFHVPR
jgi:hypothetical protein